MELKGKIQSVFPTCLLVFKSVFSASVDDTLTVLLGDLIKTTLLFGIFHLLSTEHRIHPPSFYIKTVIYNPCPSQDLSSRV